MVKIKRKFLHNNNSDATRRRAYEGFGSYRLRGL